MKIWRQQQVDQVRLSIKAELDDILIREGELARLKYCLEQTTSLANETDKLGRLRCLVYCISALYHHRLYGGLSEAQINNLNNLAMMILAVENIHPGKSSFSYFYGEIHLILSQINFLEGKYWQASWKQELASYFSRPVEFSSDSHKQLAQAIRLGRLGCVAEEITLLEAAINSDLRPKMLNVAYARLLRALRLSGQWLQFHQRCGDAAARANISPETKLDIAWERICLEITEHGKEAAMLAALRRDGTHHQEEYLLEGWLWMFAKSGKPNPRMLKYASFRRKFSTHIKDAKALTEAYRVFEECESQSLPLATRIQKIGDMLDNCHVTATLDQEMLILICAAQWLQRRRAGPFARIAYYRYRNHSLLATAGKNPDALGLGKNLNFPPLESTAA